MLKKLDWYTIKTYFGPFIFIFSVLFFIFMMQYAWQEMDRFLGKGLGFIDIVKLLFYLGLSVIQLVIPLTILLSSIMTFGGFGERYELAAMKSTGISLGRIMLPLFLSTVILSVGLFYFSDNLVPQAQRKARNMLINIAKTKPAVNFESGMFIMGVPGFSMKIDNNSGENNEFIEGVFIHKDATSYENQQTIIAEKGKFEPAEDKRFLKLSLYNGFSYEDEIKNKSREKLLRQPSRQVKFDTLVQYFDVSEIVEKAIEEETVSDHYRFMSSGQLMNRIDTLKIQDKELYDRVFTDQISNVIPTLVLDSSKIAKTKKPDLKPFSEYEPHIKEQAITRAIENINREIEYYSIQKEEIKNRNEFFARHVLILVRNYSNSIMCIVFFLIGAPLGAIIRKGGVGMPVVVAIITFVLFYIIYMYSENLSKSGVMNPYWAAWLPVIVFCPLGIFFTYQAIKDSEIFNIELYLKPFQKLFNIFGKNKKEHARYQ